MRLIPGLFVVLALTALVLGPLMTTLGASAYFSNPHVATYILRGVTLFSLEVSLPGVFIDAVVADRVNGSLWTLPHEVACYFGVLIAGLLGLFCNRAGFLAALALYLAAYLFVSLELVAAVLPVRLLLLMKLSLSFVIGVCFYKWRDHTLLSWPLTLISGAAAFGIFFLTGASSALIIWISYAVFVFAYLPGGAIRRYNLIGDYSYGVYIYAWPVQQNLASLYPEATPLANMLAAAPITLFLGILSWMLVEKPALSHRGVVAEKLASLRAAAQRRIQ